MRKAIGRLISLVIVVGIAAMLVNARMNKLEHDDLRSAAESAAVSEGWASLQEKESARKKGFDEPSAYLQYLRDRTEKEADESPAVQGLAQKTSPATAQLNEPTNQTGVDTPSRFEATPTDALEHPMGGAESGISIGSTASPQALTTAAINPSSLDADSQTWTKWDWVGVGCFSFLLLSSPFVYRWAKKHQEWELANRDELEELHQLKHEQAIREVEEERIRELKDLEVETLDKSAQIARERERDLAEIARERERDLAEIEVERAERIAEMEDELANQAERQAAIETASLYGELVETVYVEVPSEPEVVYVEEPSSGGGSFLSGVGKAAVGAYVASKALQRDQPTHTQFQCQDCGATRPSNGKKIYGAL